MKSKKLNYRSFTAVLAACLMLASLTIVGSVSAAENGEALWLDLITEDADAASAFYGDLFGWEIVSRPGHSRLIRNQGRDIAGLFEINNSMPDASESQWVVGIVSDDLDASVASVRQAGGSVLRNITDVEGSGRYAVIRDPQGALVMLGQPTREIGGPRQPGFFVWAELWTDDVDDATEFYGEVVGYETRVIEKPGGEYTVFETGGTPRAGLVSTPDEKVDPVWAPYIGVADIDAILSSTVELGGRVVVPPQESAGGRRIALIEDPSQAMIFVVELSAEEGGSR